ncbi:hypothetical protein [Sulfitobacter sp. PS-8MA]|uniref:hypothetical protein n=1 Tax=Sulfitobacter sp. PS-8MA TaxID=3237707 RepID=UPI0034C64908
MAAALAATFLSPRAVQAADVPWLLRDYIDRDLLSWVNAAPIVEAIEAQNLRHHGQAPPVIGARRAGLASLSLPLSDYLHAQVARSGGRITKVTLIDAQGLAVAAGVLSSAQAPGDAVAFPQSLTAAPGAILVDRVSFDDSTQSYRGQVTIAVVNPATGVAIGAITVGLQAVAFF